MIHQLIHTLSAFSTPIQIFLQFPRAFEFNEDFLLVLHEHSMASPYATFYFDNTLQRRKSGYLGDNTLWSYLLAVRCPDGLKNYFSLSVGSSAARAKGKIYQSHVRPRVDRRGHPPVN